MAPAAARPGTLSVAEHRRPLRGWPIGPELLAALGDSNHEVREALADERDRLSYQGYPESLPLPALWWVPSRGAQAEAEKFGLTAVDA